MKSIQHIALLFFCFSLVSLTHAKELGVGDRLEHVTLNDQFGTQGSISETTQIVIFNQDKNAADLIEETLKQLPDGYFQKNHIIYISDISAMPGFITRFIAIPAMQDRNYPILLDTQGDISKNYPRQAANVSIISINSYIIKSITYASSIKQLKQILNLAN